jgi:hypothetical protein
MMGLERCQMASLRIEVEEEAEALPISFEGYAEGFGRARMADEAG